MTTYKAIHGKLVQSLASDPDAEAYEGQLWFNSTSADYKTILKVDGAWASGADINANRNGMASAGTQTAGLINGGDLAPSPSVVGNSEEYNGATWAEGSNLNSARYNHAGAGTQTAGIFVAGDATLTVTETYDGSSYSETGDVNTGRNVLAAAGTTTAGLAFGGTPGAKNESEEFNGTGWTEGNNLNTGANALAGAGIQTAA